MPKFRPPINTLATGEISPDMAGRIDIDKYNSACRTALNFITRPHGSAYYRPGTGHVRPAKFADKLCELFEFDFNSSESQAYVLEAGHNYMRFFMQGGVILDDDDEPYEIATPWTEDMVRELCPWQSADVVWFTCGPVRPQELIRHGHADWEIKALDFRIPGWDLEITDTNADTKKDGKQGDTLNLPDGRELDGKMIVKGQNPAGAMRWFEYHGEGYWKASGAALTLTFKDTPSTASGTLEIKAIHTAAGVLNTDWVELESDSSAPKEWVDGNWPRICVIYEDRAVLASTPKEPRNWWASRVGKYTDFRKNTATDGVPLDDDAIWGKISFGRSPVKWMVDAEDLFVGTNDSEGRIWSGTDGEPMTPEAAQSKRISGSSGSCDVRGVLVGNGVLYVSRSGRKIRQLAFRTSEYRFASQEVTLFSQHITGPGVRSIAYCVEPDGVLWCARKDGVLCAATYMPDQNVVGWHRHVLGGGGEAESLASIPGERGDELWMVVKRKNADGSVRRDIERMMPAFNPVNDDGTVEVDARKAFFVDSGLSYSGAPVSEVAGLDHLEGKSVHILADGSYMAARVVSGGKVALDRAASLVHVGLGYVGELEPMPFDITLQTGTAKVLPKRVTACTFRLLHSIGGKVAAGVRPDRSFEPFVEGVEEIVPNQPPRLFSGYRKITLGGGSELDAVVCLRQDLPMPMTVVAVYPEVTVDG